MSRFHNLVDRLDRPSAYYQSKVRQVINYSLKWKLRNSIELTLMPPAMQNKRRRHNVDREDGDKAEDHVDSLKDATTLYVGNLYVPSVIAAI
jgi:nuclear cap-binding protein subunit 2